MAQAGSRSRLWNPQCLMLVFFATLVSVSTVVSLAITPGKNQTTAHSQMLEKALLDGLCPPGHHMSATATYCIPCTAGVDYTEHANALHSCLGCVVCRRDEDEVTSCTTTQNTQCQCKQGTFHQSDAPETCRPCRSRCPNGMESQPCTPWSDRKCVIREMDHRTSGDTTVPGHPEPPSGIGHQFLVPIVGITIGALILGCIRCSYKKCLPGGVPDCFRNRLFSRLFCSPREPEFQPNIYMMQTVREPHSTVVSEQHQEAQESAEWAGDTDQIPEENSSTGNRIEILKETVPLLAHAKVDTSTRRHLIPVPGVDTAETLRLCFDDFSRIIPHSCWDPLLRRMGLTDNDIHTAKTRDPQNGLYEMLVTWLNRAGRGASVNTLLDALGGLEERTAQEKVQDYLLKSGNFTYENSGAGSAESRE